VTGSALPDEAKAARIFLKDLVNGKLLFCTLPPDYNKEKDGFIIQYNTDIIVPVKEEHSKKKDVEESKTEEDPNKIKEEKEESDEEENLGDQSRIQINDDEFFEGEPTELDGDDPYEGFSNEELLLLLLEGKSVRGIRLNKNQRRDLKFAVKRGEVNHF
jgi:large subunit GTPase 1